MVQEVQVKPPYDCINTIRSADEPDDIFQNDIFKSAGALQKLCTDKRDMREIRQFQNQGWTGTTDSLQNQGRLDQRCYDRLIGLIPSHNKKGKPNTIKTGLRMV